MPLSEERQEQLERKRRVWRATNGLRNVAPHLSVHSGLTRAQRYVIIGAVLVSAASLFLVPLVAGVILLSIATTFYCAVIALRLALIVLSVRQPHDYAGDFARSIPDHELPFTSVLVPAYKEPEIVANLVRALDTLDYPRDRLEVLLVLEEDDYETIEAAEAEIRDSAICIVTVPAGEPRTKPKALNYALQVSRGSMITIYDAEDRPDPLQLRHAAAALAAGGSDLACVQAQLNYFNPEQNLITSWFTLEYSMWFTQFLPGLVAIGAPVPLGGTSNHFRREALYAVGGWDPYNVTEDADLGLRFHRMGYHVGVIDSVTLEEANSDFINWVKQRSRWYKGYLQTWLVNLRHPRRAIETLGFRGFSVLNLFVGGTPMLALLNPIFWLMTLGWFTLHPQFIRDLFPAGLFYPAMVSWMFGNFLYIYAFILTSLRRNDAGLVKAAYLIPGYYMMMSLAAYKALVQLIFNPSYWEKTQHGLLASAAHGEAKMSGVLTAGDHPAKSPGILDSP